MALAPGTRLGPYEILSPLGAGGMGEVYRARDTRLGREVAVKVLPAGFAADTDRLRRFEQEARTVGGLNHPNLITLFDVGTHDGSPYLVMELLDGETLRQKLTGKPVPAKRAVEIACAIAEGLSAAHDRGIIHRDLKPENLFLTRDGRLKILDFGLAKLQEQLPLPVSEDESTLAQGPRAAGTDSGTVLGTVGYMSPEQVRSESLDARSDIFALGIILWEMLTGYRPFRGSSAVESLHAILKDEPPDLDPALKLPPVLESILRTCLAKDPAGRFHSAYDLAFALSHLTGSGSTALASRPEFRKARRWRAWAAGAGACVALVAAFLVGRWLSPPRLFHVERLTRSPRIISSARFLPDGKSIVYTAAPDGLNAGALGELFRLSPGELPVPLGVRDCRVLDVSAAGDLILAWNRESTVDGRKKFTTVLARIPAAGGTAPRVVEEDGVNWGDRARWTRDGKEIIVRHLQYKGKPVQVIAFQGRPLYELPWGFGLGDFILNDGGDAIGFVELRATGQSFVTVGLDGQVITRTPIKGMEGQSVFRYKKNLVFLSERDENENPIQLVQLSPSGAVQRVLQNFPTDNRLWDVSPAGDILITPGGQSWVGEVRWLEPGADRERLLDLAFVSTPSLNASGTQLTCHFGRGTMIDSVALLQAGLSSATGLGEGRAYDQAPDGKSVLNRVSDPDGYFRLRLLPTGAGAPQDLPGKWITCGDSFLLESGKAFVFGRLRDDSERHPYLLDARVRSPQRLNWQGDAVTTVAGPASPDGRAAFAATTTGGDSAPWSRVDLASGALTPLPPSCAGMTPRGWNASGERLWLTRPVAKGRAFPTELWQCDLKTGKAEKAREIMGPDYPLAWLSKFTITPDGRSYAYHCGYDIPARKDLFRVSGAL